MHPLDILKNEHIYINRMFSVAERRLNSAREKDETVIELMNKISDFLVQFDEFHHEKEENILFSALLSKQLADDERMLINKLQMEHESRRDKIKELKKAATLNKTTRDSMEFAGAMVFHITALANQFKRHEESEEKSLFNLANKYFSDEEWRIIGRKFDEVTGEHHFEKLRNFLSEIDAMASVSH
ncbi:MAG: hypothetical protein GF401_02755 [Chitinivibrionales bacterium]|nr:hypothetical protein [Chitinivibrionales bacterium]